LPSRRAHIVAVRLVLVALCAGACGDFRSPTDGPNRPTATGQASFTAEGSPSGEPRDGWTSKVVRRVVPDGSTRPCVELSNRGVVATTCVSLPGVSSWIVARDHFVLASGADIAFSDGSAIRVNADGLAIGLLGDRTIADEPAPENMCDRHGLAVAIGEHFGMTSPAWLPVGCASDQVAVVEFDDPSHNIALLKRRRDWVVLGVVPAGVGCARLDGEMRDACRTLGLQD
jgi:hypothetical protein